MRYLVIGDDHLALTLALLGLGVLRTIRNGTLPAEAGIWTLCRPAFRVPLPASTPELQEIHDVFATCDELDAIQQLIPEKYPRILEALIARLNTIVLARQQIAWNLTWETPQR